jgi:DNA-binding Lrp family transcriptional regulator
MLEHDAQSIGRTYTPLAEVALAYGVSVDTVRRRLRRGETEGRKETTAQGFRCLAAIPGHTRTVGEGAAVAERGAGAARSELIATLQRELELRNREFARLHEVAERQAVALERAMSAQPQLPSQSSAEGGPAQITPVREASWQRLRRLIQGHA